MANKAKKFKNLLFTLVIVVNGLNVKTQSAWYHHQWRDQQNTEPKLRYHNVLTSIENKLKDNMSVASYSQQFAVWTAIQIEKSWQRAEIYDALEGYESYVKKVLEELVKDTSLTNHIVIRFKRSPIVAAETHENGLLLLPVGLLSLLHSEAELAMVLAHEMAHYKNSDRFKCYGRLLHAALDRNKQIEGTGPDRLPLPEATLLFSTGAEVQADRMASHMLAASGYSYEKAIHVLRTMERDVSRANLKQGYQPEPWTQHPYLAERLAILHNSEIDTMAHGKNLFIVSETSFIQLRRLCFQELVNIGFEQNHLDLVITRTFSQYLLHPEDDNLLSVLAEALRRKLLENPQLSAKRFIVDQYEAGIKANAKKYAGLANPQRSILQHLSADFLDLQHDDLSKLPAQALTDTSVTEFLTNEEAYLYFKKVTEQKRCTHAQYVRFFEFKEDVGREAFIQTNQIFATNDYLRDHGMPRLNDSALVVIMPLADHITEAYHQPTLANLKMMDDQFKQAVETELKGKMRVTSANSLNMALRIVLAQLIAFTESDLKKQETTLDVRTLADNWPRFRPELYRFFSERGIYHLYVCHVFSISGDQTGLHFFKISIPGTSKTTRLLWRSDRKFDAGHTNHLPYASFAKEFGNFVRLYGKH